MFRFPPAAILIAFVAGCSSFAQAPGPEGITIGLMGDMPYSNLEISSVDALIDEMNGEPLAFVLHVGDITSGRGPCTGAWFGARKRQLDRFRHPLVIVPGDNDWVDCHRSGPYSPLERLEKFRDLFAAGNMSLGERKLELERQSGRYAEYREHTRWIAASVLFVGLNVQGSNNNLGRTPAMDAEHARRMGAVLSWLEGSFEMAASRNLAGVLVFVHANPDFERKFRRPRGVADGFQGFRDALRAQAVRFGKPVLLVQGDEHLYINDRPLKDPATGRRIDNFMRVQVFGSPLIRWLKARIDPASPEVFEVTPVLSPAPAN